MEFQKRGSIHFHLLWFNLPWWHWKAILETWKRITGQDTARIDVRLVKSRRGVQSYVSKYIAKVEKRNGKTFLVYPPYLHGGRKWRKGRFWGYHNKKALPLGEKVVGVLLKDKEIKRMSDAAWKIIGSKVRYGSISFQLFSDHAEKLAKMNIEVGGLFSDEWTWSRHITENDYKNLDYQSKRFSEADFDRNFASPLTTVSRPSEASLSSLDASLWVKRGSFISPLVNELH